MVRGDKNKSDTTDRGGSDQTSQAFIQSSRHPESDSNNKQTGGLPLDLRGKKGYTDADRNLIKDRQGGVKSPGTVEKKFNLLVDSVPYIVKAVAFKFNYETRYRVSFNGSSEHVFTWDSSLGQLRAIDDEASTLPDNLEEAISEKLQSKG